MSEVSDCFFCGFPLEKHRDNAQGHVWRRGMRVEPEDFMRADETTQALHGPWCREQWRLRGVTVEGEQK